MTIKEVCEKYGITADTLRYYEKVGVIPTVGRTKGGKRDYSEQDIAWVENAICMRNAGLPALTALLNDAGHRIHLHFERKNPPYHRNGLNRFSQSYDRRDFVGELSAQDFFISLLHFICQPIQVCCSDIDHLCTSGHSGINKPHHLMGTMSGPKENCLLSYIGSAIKLIVRYIGPIRI